MAQKYWVTFKVDARYTAEVAASNYEEAIKKAEEKYLDADFGEIEVVSGEPVAVEDGQDIVYER